MEKLIADTGRQCAALPVGLFKTPNSYYAFDINHVNFIEINEVLYMLFSALKDSPKSLEQLTAEIPGYSKAEIRDALGELEEIQKMGFLKHHEFQRENPYTLDIIKQNLNNELYGLFLNITTKCNLSCSYCVFGGDYDNHNPLEQQEMSWETARAAIDFFLARAKKEGELRVDFFGGEPLLAFPLIKRIVATLKEELRPRNQDIFITISSNGTVMNDEILDFLLEHNAILQISIDGEKEIHDANRKFKNSTTGSFDTVMKKLAMIHDRDLDYFSSKVILKAVVTTESMDADGADFFQLPLIKLLREKRRFTLINKSPHYNLKKDADYFDRIHKLAKVLLEKKNASTLDELVEDLNPKMKGMFFMTLSEFFLIQVSIAVYFDPDKPVPFRKDCLIGIEGCVNPDGSISICYQSNSFIIGNVLENKYYYDKIEEFHTKRYSRSNACKTCFVQRFCQLCYSRISEKNDRLSASLQNYCQFTREFYRTVFQYMLEIMENNPGLWDELQEMAEKEKEDAESKKT